MGLFKRKISISDMADVLYDYTVSDKSIKNVIDALSKDTKISADIIKQEFIFLTIEIIDYLLRSKKIRKQYNDKADQLFHQYLWHFKSKSKNESENDRFINLLVDRGKTYNDKIFEINNSSNFSIILSEIFAKYCGIENNPKFIIKSAIILGSTVTSTFKSLGNLFENSKLVEND